MHYSEAWWIEARSGAEARKVSLKGEFMFMQSVTRVKVREKTVRLFWAVTGFLALWVTALVSPSSAQEYPEAQFDENASVSQQLSSYADRYHIRYQGFRYSDHNRGSGIVTAYNLNFVQNDPRYIPNYLPGTAPEFKRNGPAYGHWPAGYKADYSRRAEGADGFNAVFVRADGWDFRQIQPGIWKAPLYTLDEVGRDSNAVYLEDEREGTRFILDLKSKLVFKGGRKGKMNAITPIHTFFRANWAFRTTDLGRTDGSRSLPERRHPAQTTISFQWFQSAAKQDYVAAGLRIDATISPATETFLRNGPSRGHWPDGYEMAQARTDRAVTGFNLAYAVKYEPFFAIAQHELTEWRSTIDGVLYVFEEVGRDRNTVYLEDKKQNKWVKINVASRQIMHGPIGGPLIIIGDLSYIGRPDWSYPSYDPDHPNARNVERLVPYIVHPSASEQEIVRFRAAVAEDYRIGAEHRRAEDEYMRQNGF